MKSNFVKTAAIVVVIGIFSTSCISLPGDKSIFHENGYEIVIQDKISLLPHGSGKQTLEVSGRAFKNLISPSYAFIPEWDSIIFLTHREGGKYILHIFSLQKKVDTAIKQDGFYIGRGLGFPKTDFLACYVEKVDGDIAVLVNRGYKSPDIRYHLDRAKKTLTSMR